MESARTFVEVAVDDGWFILEEAGAQLEEVKADVTKEPERDEASAPIEAKVAESKAPGESKSPRAESKTSKFGMSWSDIVQSMEAKQKSSVYEADSETQRRSSANFVRRTPRAVESFDNDPATSKEWSQTSRARKFGEMGTGSGNTFWNSSFVAPNAASTLTKTVRLPQGMSPADEKAWKAPTRFEVEANLVFPVTRRNTSVKFSMDKKKRWEWVDDLIKPDSDLVIPTQMNRYRRFYETGKYEVSSYVMLQPETYYHKERKEDKEMAAYLSNLEKAAKVVASKRHQQVTWNMRLERFKIPEGIDCPRLAFTLKPRTAAPKVNLRAARVEMDGNNSYWAPQNLADANDFLDVDLGKVAVVTALGTKGRALQRNSQDEVMDGAPYEWVTRFKAFWKKDEREVWKPLGDFVANGDAETEAVNFVLDSRTEKPGLELRFLRIQPTAFHHRKSMRIGVYGRYVEAEEKEVETKMPYLDMLKCKDVKTSAVIYTVESKLSQERSGKFNYVRGSYSSRRDEKRQVRRADRAEIRRVGRLEKNDA